MEPQGKKVRPQRGFWDFDELSFSDLHIPASRLLWILQGFGSPGQHLVRKRQKPYSHESQLGHQPLQLQCPNDSCCVHDLQFGRLPQTLNPKFRSFGHWVYEGLGFRTV